MTTFTIFSLAQLKAYCQDHGISVDGDRRRKASYLDAIAAYQAENSVQEVLTNIADTRAEIDDLCEQAIERITGNTEECDQSHQEVSVTKITIPVGLYRFTSFIMYLAWLLTQGFKKVNRYFCTRVMLTT